MIGSIAEPPSSDPPDRADELLDVADAVLEQVPGAFGRVGEQLHRQTQLDVLREHENAHGGMARPDLEGGAHPLVVVSRRQPDVDDGDIGRVAPHLQQQILGRLAAADHLQAVLGQQALQPLPQEDAVLGDHGTHGISARSRVPPPFGLHTCNRPLEGLDAVREPPQTRAPFGVGAADSVVDDLDHDQAVDPEDVDGGRRRVRVLADVGETLGDQVEGGDLEALGKPALESDRQPNGERARGRRAARARSRARVR